jgi:gas vesicle protein GvpN
MLLFGDDEFKTSDLIGNQSGYTRKKVVDNFIHSVVKVEDELRQNWVDSRLTLACREGFTLVYDEFNRSRPEVNNVLLSALEEKLLVLPPSNNRAEYIRVNSHFRAIFTSNPEEYCGVHDTQDALLDRLITINMPEPDELTQQEIAVQKTGIDRESALTIVRLVKTFRNRTGAEKSSGLRSCLMLAKICQEHGIVAITGNPEFRDVCQDILLSRAGMAFTESRQILWQLFNEPICEGETPATLLVTSEVPALETIHSTAQPEAAIHTSIAAVTSLPPLDSDQANATARVESEEALTEAPLEVLQTPVEPLASSTEASQLEKEIAHTLLGEGVPYEREVFSYLQQSHDARPSEIEAALGISRYDTVNALRSLTEKGLLTPQSHSHKLIVSQQPHTVHPHEGL